MPFVANAQTANRNTVIIGKVIDEKNNKPVSSATIRIENTNKGTIADKDGNFRLPKSNFGTNTNIKVTAVGYKPQIITLDLREDSIHISMIQNPVVLKGATVIGDITVEEIIRRAIDKKEENRRKYKTMQSQLYTKISMDFDKMQQTIGQINTEVNEFGVSFNTKKQKKKENDDSLRKQFMQGMVYETISKRYVDIPKRIDKTIIVNRRQTANIPQQLNQFALTEFIDFSQDEVSMLDTRIMTPLHHNALWHYDFELIDRQLYDTSYVYAIKVIPDTELYPVFEGTISIIEGTYQLVELNLKPSIDTKILMLDSVSFYEKFEDIGNNVWMPTYFENKFHIKAKIIPLIPAIEVTAGTTAIVSDVVLDQPLPKDIMNEFTDSARKANKSFVFDPNTAVLKNADSAKPQYWEDNALIQLTDREQKIYKEVDSAAKELDVDMNINVDSMFKMGDSLKGSFKEGEFFADYFFFPFGRSNRVEIQSFGLLTEFTIPYTTLTGDGVYSMGPHRWLGKASLTLSTDRQAGSFDDMMSAAFTFNVGEMEKALKPKSVFELGAGILSDIATFAHPFGEANLLSNSVDFWIFGQDYYDYYRKDGWNATAAYKFGLNSIKVRYENVRVKGFDKATDKTLFSKGPLRANPQPLLGEFTNITATASSAPIIPNKESFQIAGTLNYLYGWRGNEFDYSHHYEQGLCSLAVQFPILETGYGKILLYLAGVAGYSSHNTPTQNVFAIDAGSMFSIVSSPSHNSFVTAYNTGFGGTAFYSLHARLNLRDWWWRLLHLPKIKGRGLELSLAVATGRFFNKSEYWSARSLYKKTGKNNYYTETGIRIGRIPIPGTDLLYWSIEGRVGVGNLASGNWGGMLGLQLPF
jgi:hypothetical protein